MPWVVQGLVWLLFVPITVGLWPWQLGWPLLLRLVLMAALAAWSILIVVSRAAEPGS